ncbi:MAG TPA: TauD/TfdA family dioxygenase, partial [Pyrinomonadaceae bacterium]|nr:TauD/TfdA family dioxygenase [Pyrinomonadaceae bacterium]
ESFVRSFSGRETLDYAGGVSPRVELGSGVYTSTEYPSNFTLSLHNELSYSNNYPENLYFCCLVPAREGGETTVGDSRTILKNIDPKIVDLFRNRGVRYDRNLHGEKGTGYSWQDAFETEDKAAVENHCRKIGADFRWKDDGGLWTSQVRPATIVHPVTGEEVWFNQADGFHPSNGLNEEEYQTLLATLSEDEFRLNARFGDGTPLDLEMLRQIREVMQKETTPIRWQAGDILILDNLLTAHGRMPFSGARKIVLAMT